MCGGRASHFGAFHLPLADHVHHLNAAQNDARTTKILEAEHGPGSAFDGPVVLLDAVDLTDADGCFACGVDGLEGGQIGTAPIHVDRLRGAVPTNRFLEEAARCRLIAMGAQQEVDGVAGLVHGSIEIPPLAP